MQRIRVPEVAYGHVHGQAGQGRVVRIAGQDPHLPARGQEFLHHGPAHEAGAAGHQGFTGLRHWKNLPRSRSVRKVMADKADRHRYYTTFRDYWPLSRVSGIKDGA